MKKYIIMSGSVDETTAQDDGAINAFNFELVGSRACDTLQEAIEVRDQTIEQDLEDFKGIWIEEDGYFYDTVKMGDRPDADVCIDIYYNGDVTNETVYKIREVEF